MLDVNKVIHDNQSLIDRFVNLCLCKDTIYDSRYRWFYSLISKDRVSDLISFLCADDLRSEICVYILERARKYKKTEIEFSQYLKKAIGWYIKDHLLKLERYYKYNYAFSQEISIDTTQQIEPITIDLNWVITNTKINLNTYDKYLLYLYCQKCYTISEIEPLVYQEKTTLSKQLNSIKRIARNYYAPKESNPEDYRRREFKRTCQ
jgi:hypothetical protein